MYGWFVWKEGRGYFVLNVDLNNLVDANYNNIMGRLLELPEEGVENKTFVFLDEGHTLGNALRYVISQYPTVTLCGYTLEHPAESKMVLRIQTKGGNAYELLKRGLEDLGKMCDHTIETFDKAYKTYESSQDSVEST